MFNAEIQQSLASDSKSDQVSNVYVYIEGDLYYPIKTIRRDKDGNYIIVCKNIKKIG